MRGSSSDVSTARSPGTGFPLLSEGEKQRIHDIMRLASRSRSTTIRSCVEDILSGQGKLLRPALLVLSARAALAALPAEAATEELWSELYRLAAAVELLHTATLVHDDVIDRAGLRRSRPTVYAQHGARTAILVGDHLVVSAFQLISDLADQSSIALISRTLRTITEGEILQMERMDPAKPMLRPYFHQIIGKTAALFAASCRVGAQHAGGNARHVQSLQRAGYNLGMAFQIVDDILDFDENPVETGKSPGRDLELGLITLPVLCALKQESGTHALRDLLSKETVTEESRRSIRARVEILGGFAKAREWAELYSRRATRELRVLAKSDAREQLLDMVEGLKNRSA